MTINHFISWDRASVEKLPKEILTKILLDVKDLKMERVCKIFCQVMQSEVFWQSIGKDLSLYNFQLVSELVNPSSYRETIQAHLRKQMSTLKSAHRKLWLESRHQILDPIYNAKIELFCNLYFKCRQLELNFKFSSWYDQKFEDHHLSLDYCIEYMDKVEMSHVLYSACQKIDPTFRLCFSAYSGNHYEAFLKESRDYNMQQMKTHLTVKYELLSLKELNLLEAKQHLKNFIDQYNVSQVLR